MESTLTAPLECFSRADLQQAGGKGANLGELIHAGFPVPAGFVVTTDAYDRFVESNHLSTLIERGQPVQLPGAQIHAAFETASIPPEVEQELLEAYHKLGAGPVAVRSSATAEDLPEAAFAGQQDTFLNVSGEQALLDAVRRCWASLWGERAIAYRSRQGLEGSTVKLAVVVQRMVMADVAGVMFTANPVTGVRDETVIDASPGLGEAVVSGLVTPDHYVLRKRRWGWSIVIKNRGRGEVVIRPRPGGGTERARGPGESDRPVLSGRDLRRLARLGAGIQRLFGSPQDIEWARVGGELFILQARPITALTEPAPHPSKPLQMLAGMFAEMFPIRPYPLDQTSWVPAISSAAVEPIFSLIGLQVPPIHRLFIEEDGVVVRFSGELAVHPTPAVLLAPLRILYLAIRYDPLHWRDDPLLLEGQRRARLLEALELDPLAWESLLGAARETLSLALPLAGEIRRRYYPRALLAAGLLRALLGLSGSGGQFGALLSGAESQTLKGNRALEALASYIRSDPSLSAAFAVHAPGELRAALAQQPSGREFFTRLDAFLQRYGHREVVLSTVLQPTWKDDPEMVLGMLKGYAQVETPAARERPAWEAAREAVLARPLLRLPPFRRASLRLIETARSFFLIREDTHFEAARILPILRRILLEMGRRLVEQGVIPTPEDVFHLKFSELEAMEGKWPPTPQAAARLSAAVQKRKERRAALEGQPIIDPRLFRQPEQGGETLLRGTAGSPGVVEGPARVIHDVSEFSSLQPGEVLVAPYTNPSWTVLFQRAIAVVVDGGAAGSHAAIVAREYGIPAVMGTVTGTQKLKDGDWVRVDGSHGLVQLGSRPGTGKE